MRVTRLRVYVFTCIRFTYNVGVGKAVGLGVSVDSGVELGTVGMGVAVFGTDVSVGMGVGVYGTAVSVNG